MVYITVKRRPQRAWRNHTQSVTKFVSWSIPLSGILVRFIPGSICLITGKVQWLISQIMRFWELSVFWSRGCRTVVCEFAYYHLPILKATILLLLLFLSLVKLFLVVKLRKWVKTSHVKVRILILKTTFFLKKATFTKAVSAASRKTACISKHYQLSICEFLSRTRA